MTLFGADGVVVAGRRLCRAAGRRRRGRMTRSGWSLATGLALVFVLAPPVVAQWLTVPQASTPRTPDGHRPDVAAVYGERFRGSGYGLRVEGLAPGSYDLAVFAWSSARHAWLPAKVVRIEVK